MRALVENFKRNLEKVGRQLEPNLTKRRYYQYLDERRVTMYSAAYDEAKLLPKLDDPHFQPNLSDFDKVVEIASQLSDFGLPCHLFDDLTYCAAISEDETDINDIWSTTVLHVKTRDLAVQKELLHQLTSDDLRQAAAISYHLQSLRWLATGIVPVLHSPYRLPR